MRLWRREKGNQSSMTTKEEWNLLENERVDDLQRNGLKIIQKTDGFCFGMDAVLLSGFYYQCNFGYYDLELELLLF